jgi:prepilin-type processing-associated H-X9-DG protein
LWWWQTLDTNRYVTASGVSNNLWRCPAVMPKDIATVFGARWEGYGPVESTVIRYGFETDGRTPLHSRRVTDIRRASQVWLMGDTGVPKNPNKVPSSGYTTEIVTFPPDPVTRDWKIYTPPKQPGCRHGGRANVVFVDGHFESWKYEDLRNNKNDIFALRDLFMVP